MFYLVDLLQDTNKEVRKTASKALDVIQDTSEEWAVKLRAIKFEVPQRMRRPADNASTHGDPRLLCAYEQT